MSVPASSRSPVAIWEHLDRWRAEIPIRRHRSSFAPPPRVGFLVAVGVVGLLTALWLPVWIAVASLVPTLAPLWQALLVAAGLALTSVPAASIVLGDHAREHGLLVLDATTTRLSIQVRVPPVWLPVRQLGLLILPPPLPSVVHADADGGFSVGWSDVRGLALAGPVLSVELRHGGSIRIPLDGYDPSELGPLIELVARSRRSGSAADIPRTLSRLVSATHRSVANSGDRK